MNRWLWVVVLALFLPSLAFAQSVPVEPSDVARQEAAERFERGVELFREQAFRAALVEFQRAYDLAPDYRLLYNLGRAKHQLQDYLGAAQNYELYLAQGGSDIAPERRIQVEETLTALRARVGRLRIFVNHHGAELFLDDVKVGVAPLAQLVLANVGRHRVSARGDDGALSAAFVDIAGGDIAEVRLELEDVPVAASSTAIEQPVETERPWSTSRRVALASWIAGGALLATGAATGVYSLKATSEYRDEVRTLGSTREDVQQQRTRADRLSLATDVLIGAGAAAVITGTIMWLVSPERRESRSNTVPQKRASLGLKLGMRSLGLSGSF